MGSRVESSSRYTLCDESCGRFLCAARLSIGAFDQLCCFPRIKLTVLASEHGGLDRYEEWPGKMKVFSLRTYQAFCSPVLYLSPGYTSRSLGSRSPFLRTRAPTLSER